jgi:hypothetical protein
VDDAVAVGISDGIRDLARQIEPHIERQGGATLAEKVIEADFAGFAPEEDRRTQFVFLKIERV